MTSRVVLSVRVDTSPERAFAAFTDDIGDWWVNNALFRLTPRSPGRLAFTILDDRDGSRALVEHLPNGRMFVVGDVREWSPGKRLVLGWRAATFGPDHATEVEVRFEPAGDGARITLEHRGWESVPQDHVARHGFPLPLFLRRLGEAWRVGLDRLAARIEHPGDAGLG